MLRTLFSVDPGQVKIVLEAPVRPCRWHRLSPDRGLTAVCELTASPMRLVATMDRHYIVRQKGAEAMWERAFYHDGMSELQDRFDGRRVAVVVRIECEIYPNCPRYVPDLAGAKLSPYVPREGQGPPPPPEWKKRDYIRDILPDRDPHAEIVKASPPES